MPIKVFGDFEKNERGKPRSDYPGWYYEGRRHLEDLEDQVRARERALDMEAVSPEKKGEFREALKREKERLDKIRETVPKLEGEAKDRIHRLSKDLGGQISDAQYTRTDMMLGLADIHGEAERMSKKKMEIKSEDEAALAKELNIKIVDGKISRTDKERMWKVARKALGESTNTEALRRERDSRSGEIKSALKRQAKEIGTAKRRGRPVRPKVETPPVEG
uniref:Uncharacterized protein n=1 Tax=viral metagenome TaxID=1070528 RepID=A0A6H1Z889_9ZZZZ